MTNILTSHIGRQLLGACAGMAVAGLLYVFIDQTSNIKGLLVSTKTITVTSESNINAKDANEAALRRVATRAQTVAANLAKELGQTQAETPLTNLVSSRRAARQFAVQLKDLAANAQTYTNDPSVAIDQKDRLAIRAARVTQTPAPTSSSQATSDVSVPAPEVSATADTVTVVDAAPLHEGAQVIQAPPRETNLPNSGLGLNLLVLVTLVAAFVTSHTTWRSKLASMISSLRIG